MQLAAFGVLGPHIDETYAGILNTYNLVHINAAHHAEMGEGLRLAVQRRSRVHEHVASIDGGDNGGKPRTFNAFDPLDDEVGADDNGAGAAAADKGVSRSTFQEIKSRRHGTVGFFLQQRSGFVLHADNAGGVVKDDPFQRNVVFPSRFFEDFLVAGDDEVDAVLPDSQFTALKHC